MCVIGEPEVDEHDLTVVPEDHILRLQIEMDRVLEMQAVERISDCRTDRRDLVCGERTALEHVLQAFALNPLDHQIRGLREVAAGHEPRHMGPRKRRQDHRLGLETDEALAVLSRTDARHFHDHRETAVRPRDAEDAAHRAGVDAGSETKPVELGFRTRLLGRHRTCNHIPFSTRYAIDAGNPASRILRAAAR